MKGKKTFADILKAEQQKEDSKLQAKLPLWAGTEGIEVPTRLALEQCSSSQTAAYKASVASKILSETSGRIIADLTGGLGADSFAFSGIAEKVIYNEINPVLADAASRNFERLGRTNIQTRCSDAADALRNLGAPVGLIYLDPARRDSAGKKAFMLKDCTPDVLQLKEDLLQAAPAVLVKLSPMADISQLARDFAPNLSEVHIVGAKGECKEILCLLRRAPQDSYTITAASGTSIFSFSPEEEKDAHAPLSGIPNAGEILLEPASALMKAGAFNLTAQRLNLKKLGVSTHLYIGDSDLEGMFKRFLIEEVLPFGGQSFSLLRSRHLKGSATARNVPVSSEGFAKKAGLLTGEGPHLFALGADMEDGSSKRIILVCKAL